MKRTPNRPSIKNSSSRNPFSRVGRAISAIFFCNSFTAVIQPESTRRRTSGQNQHLPIYEDSTTSNSSTGTKYLSYGSSNAADHIHLSPLNLSFHEIRKATGNFSLANQIGEGAFGTVYKGKLKDGSFIAVKRAKIDNDDERLSAEFKNEILTLSKIEHFNLVRLLGFLEHGPEKFLVVEYVTNGSLREHLDGSRGNGLEITERLEIAIDVAQAIAYLHNYAEPPIIHRDIKASNVLITERLRAKVADFGFARLAAKDPGGATHVYTDVKGTAGYLDPEYLKTYQLTDKSDVYSFGVLLAEMMTGRHPIEESKGLQEKVTLTWALRRLKEGETVIAMDPRIRRTPASIQAVEKILKLARECVATSRYSRPSMKKCLEVLWEIRNGLRSKTLSLPDSTPIQSSKNEVSTPVQYYTAILEESSQNEVSTPIQYSTAILEETSKNEERDLYEITNSDYHRFYTA